MIGQKGPHAAAAGASSSGSDVIRTRFTIHTVTGELLHTSEDHAPSLHPTFAPLPATVRAHSGPSVSVTLFEVEPHGSVKRLYSADIDLRLLRFEARNFAALSRTGVPVGDSNSPILLFKCDDGIFSTNTTSGGKGVPRTVSMAEEADEPLSKAEEGEQDAWDFVDADMVRDEERRMERATECRAEDILSYIAATTSTHHALCAARQARARASGQLVRAHAARRATVQATAACRKASSARAEAELGELQRLVDEKRRAIETKRQEIAARRAALEADESTVLAVDNSTATRFADPTLLHRHVSKLRSRLLQHVAQLLQVDASGPTVTVLGRSVIDDFAADENSSAMQFVAPAIDAVSAVLGQRLLHPVSLESNKWSISDGWDGKVTWPLTSTSKADRVSVQNAVQLLRADVSVAAYAAHGQRQAQGLPLGLSFYKLLCNS